MLNHKGVFTRDRTPKLAAHALRKRPLGDRGEGACDRPLVGERAEWTRQAADHFRLRELAVAAANRG